MKESTLHQPHFIYLDEILVPIANELGHSEGTEQTLALIESLFSTICRTLPFSQAVLLFTALPLPFQSLTLGRWEVDQRLSDPIDSLSNLLDEIAASDPYLFSANEGGKELAKRTLLAILNVVSAHTSPENLEQIISVFPHDAQQPIYTSIQSYHNKSLSTSLAKASDR